jgi:glucose-1-phosphate adenylyltransferase
VHVNSYCELNAVVALPNVTIHRNCRLSNAIIDAEVTVPPGLVVGEDPEEDARRFRRTDKGIVLITQPMIDALT